MSTPAGWYPDPHNPGMMRWWDGGGWLDQWRPQSSTVRHRDYRSIGTAYLLLIFAGGLGVHRFYLGRSGTALILIGLNATTVIALLAPLAAGHHASPLGLAAGAALALLLFVDLVRLPALVEGANEEIAETGTLSY